VDQGLNFIRLLKSQIRKSFVGRNNQFNIDEEPDYGAVPCKSLESFISLPAKRRSSSSCGGMYLNWNRSRCNTASTAPTHIDMHKHGLSLGFVAWV